MTEILTKEIGTNQIATSFNKVKEYYLFSKENKESILKSVKDEFFDGYSFQDVKDYYKNMADEKVEEIRENYGFDITNVRDYIINNPGVVEKVRSFFSYGTLTIDPSTVITGSFKLTENPYQSNYRMVEIIDFEYDIDTLIDSGIERFIPLEVLKSILGFFKAYYLATGIQINKDDVNDVEKIIERITSSWSAKNALYSLNNIICGVSSERVYKQKVYFSLLKNKLVFSKTNCEDLLLIAEFKTSASGFSLFKDCVKKDDMTEFYDYVVKRIISGLKRQTSKTISYNQYPLASAVKGYVPICLYTDEEILSRISHFNINDIKSIIKNTSDPDQVKRLIKLWQDSMI